MFQRLKTLQVNKLDDGRVIGHMNADDPLTTLPDNYATIQIIPANGQVRTFRP